LVGKRGIIRKKDSQQSKQSASAESINKPLKIKKKRESKDSKERRRSSDLQKRRSKGFVLSSSEDEDVIVKNDNEGKVSTLECVDEMIATPSAEDTLTKKIASSFSEDDEIPIATKPRKKQRIIDDVEEPVEHVIKKIASPIVEDDDEPIKVKSSKKQKTLVETVDIEVERVDNKIARPIIEKAKIAPTFPTLMNEPVAKKV
jgi:uncharacterized protein YuzE